MANKKNPNAALIESLKPEKPIAYDPELLQALAGSFQREWQKLETLRREVYRRVAPNIWLDKFEAEKAGDSDRVREIELGADERWSEITGAPAIASWESLEVVMAMVAAEGYPETDAGLHAWVISKSIKPDLDGPCGFNQWRHNGELVRGTMQPSAWNICAFLWEQAERTALFDDLYEVATGDREETQFDFKSAAQKAKQFFNANDIPWRLSVSERSRKVTIIARK